MADIEINNLSFAYPGGQKVLWDLSMVFSPGQVVSILGPNGCGKTTLLKLVLGLLTPPKGAVRVLGQKVEDLSRQKLARLISYVPQSSALVFHYKALEMVLMGRVSRGPWYRYQKEDLDRARAALARIGLEHLSDRSYIELSGGERQLVLIARALAQQAPFMVMDEPASSLDYGNQFRLLDLVRQLSQEGLSIILTTHHPEQAIYLEGRAILIKDGRIKADGSAKDLVNTNSIAQLYSMPQGFVQRLGHLGSMASKTG
ncbi:MAG: ABC transporter ATP-binding protein [Deltaproteobacteria bacterium]|nr:ABC transporter ATP-binding protein [Deltaproteobacteria bacterium]